METGPLANQVVIIIGGTSGLGLSGALACQRAGAQIVAVGKDQDSCHSAANALGASAVIQCADATAPDAAPAALQLALQKFSRVDALYHVAGGSGRKLGDGPLHEATDAGWAATLHLNLTSLFYSNRAAARHFLAAQQPGSILNMSSILAWSPSPHFFTTHAYAAAKAAVLGLTTSCAAYYAPHNIRFNALAPGLIDTPMAQRAMHNQNIQKFLHSKQPLDGGRAGTPEDLDAAVVFLLSPQSKFITGQVLAVDGGWSVTEGQIPGDA